MEPVKVLIIDDNFTENDPLIISLREIFGDENVILKKRSGEGLQYVLDHLTSKLIVLLDLDLGTNEPQGVEVFEKIRDKTSLVYIIIITAQVLSTIPTDDLIKFINNDALAIINNTADTDEIVKLVERAAHQLDTRVDCILEQWIAKRPEEDRQKPYLTTRSDKTYTLDDLIVEIRKETELGKRLEKGILQLAIDLLTEGKEKLNA